MLPCGKYCFHEGYVSSPHVSCKKASTRLLLAERASVSFGAITMLRRMFTGVYSQLHILSFQKNREVQPRAAAVSVVSVGGLREAQ